VTKQTYKLAGLSDYRVRQGARPSPFGDEELLTPGPGISAQRTLTGPQLNEVAFPLGGLGTGCVSFSGRGELVDWEIFNRPNKGYRPDFSFFSLFAQAEGGAPVFRVLEGPVKPPYQGAVAGTQFYRGWGFGPPLAFGSGFIHMAECRFTGYFPFCRVDLADDETPIRVSTEAWSPFIPLNDHESSLPVAVFDVTLTNTGDVPMRASVALGLQNVLGYPEIGDGRNEWVEGDGWRGVAMTTAKHKPTSPRYGTLALLTPDEDVTYQLRFGSTAWFEATESLMDVFGQTGEFRGPRDPRQAPDGQNDVAELGLKVSLAPGESVRRTFVLAWLMPTFEKYWGQPQGAPVALGAAEGSRGRTPTWPIYQARHWADAVAVARYTIANLSRLRDETRRFAEAFFSSTLPAYVLEGISSQMSILRSPTITRLTDGTVYGWEGCHANEGCCEGSCTHVWNYAQTMAYLFPALERGMREMDYSLNLRESDGHMQFRLDLPPGTPASHTFHAAADGQLGGVLRTYREWQISGDDDWLRRLWPSAKRALEYAWLEWDKDRDGLLEGIHHNTLDIEFHGPETMCGSMYLAALRAGEAMARRLGDDVSADEYHRIYESGRRLSEERLFNGEYFYQRITPGDDAPYQFGPGCIIDQVLGGWHARMYGLGDIYAPDKVASALQSVFRYNFHDSFRRIHNPHRVFALGDDRGTVICTWPQGGRPPIPTTYAFECMIGFEYQVGCHMVYEGFLREGLTVFKAVRDRHDGFMRNPYNEFECGNHYARSLANYAYLLALSGFRYSAPERTLYLNPALAADDFRCFFSVEGAWGVIEARQAGGETIITVETLAGELPINKIALGNRPSVAVTAALTQ
jgi:non-lysosomal glucosylceramidase